MKTNKTRKNKWTNIDKIILKDREKCAHQYRLELTDLLIFDIRLFHNKQAKLSRVFIMSRIDLINSEIHHG